MLVDLRKRFYNLSSMIKKDKREILSLDIGKSALKIADFSLSRGKIELLNYGIKELDKTQEESRFIADFISDFIKMHSIQDKEIIISIQDPDALAVKRKTLPNVPDKEIIDAIKWEIKDELSFNLAEAQMYCDVVGEYTDKEGARKKDIVVTCVNRVLIDKYVKIIKEEGLSIIDIKLPVFNYSYLLEKDEQSKKAVIAVLDVGGLSASISIYRDNKLNFIRSLPFSSVQMTEDMRSALVTSAGKIELTYDKAEEIKKEFGIPDDPEEVLKEGIKGGQAISLMRPGLERLAAEISRSIDYYTSNFETEAPQVLYITGGGSNLKNLDKYLKNELKLEVKRLLLPPAIHIAEYINKETLAKDINQLSSPAGAVLGMDKKPGFLPVQYKAEKLELIEKISLRLVGIAAGLLFLFSFLIANLQVNDYRNRLKNAKLHLETIKGISDLNDRIVQRQALIDKINSDKIPADWILKELAGVMPSTAILKEIKLNQSKNSVILNGYIIAQGQKMHDELAAFINALERSPLFKEAALTSSSKSSYDGRDALSFEIQCELAI